MSCFDQCFWKRALEERQGQSIRLRPFSAMSLQLLCCTCWQVGNFCFEGYGCGRTRIILVTLRANPELSQCTAFCRFCLIKSLVFCVNWRNLRFRLSVRLLRYCRRAVYFFLFMCLTSRSIHGGVFVPTTVPFGAN